MLTTPVETLQLIQKTAQQAIERKLVPLPNNPQAHLLIGEGKYEVIPTPFVDPPRRHTVLSIADFADAYQRWYLDGNDIGRAIGKPDPSDEIPEAAEVLVEQPRVPNIWCDLDNWRLVFFVDEPLRRSWVKLQLKASPQYGTVFKFRDGQTLDQQQFVRMLRHDLIGCVEPAVLQAFRSVDFQKIVTAKRNIQHERQSLDADLVASVQGEKKPEEFLVTFPMLASRELDPFRAGVKITVDMDAERSKFVLQAVPGQLDLAMEELRSAIVDTLESGLQARGLEDVTILCGNPGKSNGGADE
jgi:hypothetical protein